MLHVGIVCKLGLRDSGNRRITMESTWKCRKKTSSQQTKKLADEPVSRILCGAPALLRTTCRGDHSSRSRLAPRLQQPTRGLLSMMACAIVEGGRSLSRTFSASRAGSPLLFGLAPRGVFRASPVARRAVGSYPTFSPLPAKALFPDDEQVSLPPVTEALFRGGLFSVALSVTPSLDLNFRSASQRRPLALPGALP